MSVVTQIREPLEEQTSTAPSSSTGVKLQQPASKPSAVARMNQAILGFELVTVVTLQLLMIVVIGVSTVVLFTLAIEALRTQVGKVDSVSGLLFLVQRSIAGVLVVVLGLEVLETLKAYFRDHYVRLEVILVVAIIAVGRHLVQIDFEHASPWVLLGLSAVIVSLTFGYFLVKKAILVFPMKPLGTTPDSGGEG
jgi:uncharacterized membrane protein (DUF373 family)